ncbi:MAG: hypothetical protein WBH77_09940 [Saccharofermentanales bacterium]
MTTLIEEVKYACMVGDTSDENILTELELLVNAAKEELKTAGVNIPAIESDLNSLLRTAIIFYCKAHFGYDNPDSDRYERRFDELKVILSLDKSTRYEVT